MQGTEIRLRLLSYNIQTGIAATRPHHYITYTWRHFLPHAETIGNLDNIASLIAPYDVVALQEVDAGSLRTNFINQIQYLAHQAGFPYWHWQTNRDLGKFAQVSLGILSRLEPTEIRGYRLPGAIPGRGALMARFGEGPEALVLFVIHLALGRRSRLRQLAYLTEVINQHRNVILMGDMNCQSSSPEMQKLLANTQLRKPGNGLHTFPSWRPNRHIDHILVSHSLRVTQEAVLQKSLSDHLPMTVEILAPTHLAPGYLQNRPYCIIGPNR